MKYTVEHYNPDWPIEFEKVKAFLRTVFLDKTISIEHVGSTSVPGMRAKPLIDVLIVVDQISPFESEKEKMIQAGYEWRENSVEPNSLLFYKTHDGHKTENIHICVNGSDKTKQFIKMRDYLRTHPEKAKEYGDLKEKLKAQFPEDYIAYREGKDSFLRNVEKLSREE